MGKIIILSFDDNEEDAYERILHNIHGVFHYDCSDIPEKATSLHIGALEIDANKRYVAVNNIEIGLTHIEFEILYLLANSPGRIYSKEQIYERVWNDDFRYATTGVSDIISSLRKKLGLNARDNRYIQTVHGTGYRFTNPE